MSFRRYERYKQSGVEWLGEVPEHWSTLPLLAVGRERDEKNSGMAESNLLSLSYGRIIRKDINTNEGLLPGSFETYQIVYPGDIIFRLTDLQNDKRSLRTAIVEERGIITSAYLALEPFSADPQFLNYLLRAYDLGKVFYAMGSGVRQSMNYEDVKRMEMLLPAPEEQVTIAKFLDRETAKIDALIEEQRRLIALMKEKRQTVISHAVTKGLNKVPMKDSGVDWLGEVPRDWTVSNIKNFASRITDGAHVSAETENGEYPFVSTKDVSDRCLDFSEALLTSARSYAALVAGGCKPHRGDVLFSKDGALVGKTVVVREELDFVVASSLIIITPIAGLLLPDYFYYLCQSILVREQIEYFVKGAALPRLSIKNLLRFTFVFPSVNEQSQIVGFLERESERVEKLTAAATRAINLLQERRSALISAAVTGKINVTAHAAKPVRSTWSTGFARQVLAAETLSRCNGPRMGRIKLQKLIHLCEYHAQLDELGSTYSRKAAGPFDAQAMAGVRKGLLQQRWFEEFKEGGRYEYRPLEKEGGHKQYLPHWENKQAKIDQVLNLLGDARTRTCEIASTLYAAWNDLLLEGKNPTDAEIIHEASSAERWHESKEKIDADKWPKALEWMRAKSLVPIGYGAHTKHKSEQSSEEPHEPA